MPDWLLAVVVALGVVVAIPAACVAGLYLSRWWQGYQDRRVWKR